jgi:membrane-associated protein
VWKLPRGIRARELAGLAAAAAAQGGGGSGWGGGGGNSGSGPAGPAFPSHGGGVLGASPLVRRGGWDSRTNLQPLPESNPYASDESSSHTTTVLPCTQGPAHLDWPGLSSSGGAGNGEGPSSGLQPSPTGHPSRVRPALLLGPTVPSPEPGGYASSPRAAAPGADAAAPRSPSASARLQALFSRGGRRGLGGGAGGSVASAAESGDGSGAGPDDLERRLSSLALRRAHTLAHALSLPQAGRSGGGGSDGDGGEGVGAAGREELGVPGARGASFSPGGMPRPWVPLSAAGGSFSSGGGGAAAVPPASAAGAALRRAVTAVRTVHRAGLSAASKGALVHAVADGALASFIIIQVGAAWGGTIW